MERLLEKRPVMQLEARQLEESLSSDIGSMVISTETISRGAEIPQEVKSEVEQTRYGETVIAALQLHGDIAGQNPLTNLLKNMGMPYAQKGRKNNIDTAVRKLADLELIEIPENQNIRKKGEINLTALGQAYEVKPEIIEEVKTSSVDQNSGK